MLKYKVKGNIESTYNELNVSDLYVAHDFSYISGYTSYLSDVADGDEVAVTTDNMETDVRKPIHLKKIRRQGYIITKEKYEVLKALDEATQASANYINIGGVYYYEFNNGNVTGYYVNNKFYFPENGYVTIPTTHYIENGKVTIKDIELEVDLNLIENSDYEEGYEYPTIRYNKYSEPIETIDDSPIQFYNYGYNHWRNCYSFYIGEVNEHYSSDISFTAMNRCSEVPYITVSDVNIYPEELEYTYEYSPNDDTGVTVTSSKTVYGFSVNGEVYPILECESYDDWYAENAATQDGYSIDVKNYDGYDIRLSINSTMSANTQGEELLLFINEHNIRIDGEEVVASTEFPYKAPIIYDNGLYYALYDGKKYLVKEPLIDTVNILGSEYELNYIDDEKSAAYAVIGGENMYLSIIDDLAYSESPIMVEEINTVVGMDFTLSEQKYQSIYEGDDYYESINGKYAYEITHNYGIEIDGNKYYAYIMDDDVALESGTHLTSSYANVTSGAKIRFTVSEVAGANRIKLNLVFFERGDLNNDLYESALNITPKEEVSLYRDIVDYIYNNQSIFKFYIDNGLDNITPSVGVNRALLATEPFSSNDIYGVYSTTKIYLINNFIKFPLQLTQRVQNNLLTEDNVRNYSTSEEIDGKINRIVDMERDIYYPAYINSDGGHTLVSELQFNFHFLNRDLDSWKVKKDNAQSLGVNEYLPSVLSSLTSYDSSNTVSTIAGYDESTNWFVTDYYPYRRLLELDDEESSATSINLQSMSDLVGLLNFNKYDIMYQKNKVGRTFLRLSYYSTNDPSTQVLLSTSTIFLDNKALSLKYRNNGTNSGIIYYENIDSVESASTIVGSGDSRFSKIGVLLEPVEDFSGATNNSYAVPSFDEDNRLSSRITVKDKFNSDTSSEGFYLYLFKEYSPKLREGTIYLRIDFCHAGIGRSYPFIIPMGYDAEGNFKPLYLDNYYDLAQLKHGVELTNKNENLYIPINVTFDEDLKKYIYYLPEIYRENSKTNTDDSIMQFNLFEIKYANEAF